MFSLSGSLSTGSTARTDQAGTDEGMSTHRAFCADLERASHLPCGRTETTATTTLLAPPPGGERGRSHANRRLPDRQPPPTPRNSTSTSGCVSLAGRIREAAGFTCGFSAIVTAHGSQLILASTGAAGEFWGVARQACLSGTAGKDKTACQVVA